MYISREQTTGEKKLWVHLCIFAICSSLNALISGSNQYLISLSHRFTIFKLLVMSFLKNPHLTNSSILIFFNGRWTGLIHCWTILFPPKFTIGFFTRLFPNLINRSNNRKDVHKHLNKLVSSKEILGHISQLVYGVKTSVYRTESV